MKRLTCAGGRLCNGVNGAVAATLIAVMGWWQPVAAEVPARLSLDAEATPSASALRVPVLREAQDIRGTVVAVDVAVVGEHLEAMVSARLPGVRKPRLQNILFVATGQGRRPPLTRREVLASLEEEAPYPTRRSGMIQFGGPKERTAKGTLVREHFAFALPAELELRDNGNYELWVDVDESQYGGHPWRFKFELDQLPEAVRTARGSL